MAVTDLTMRPRTASPAEQLDALLELNRLLAQVSREIGPALELQPVLTVALRAMRRLVDFKGGSICLVDGDGVFIAAADPDIVTPDVAAARVPIGKGLAGRVVAGGRPIYSGDLDLDDRVDQHLRRMGSNASIKSYLGVPLVCLGQVIGLLQVDSAHEDAFDQQDLQVLEGLATQVAGSIESARRYEQVLELERLKTDFLARVSHELRTPLTIISGMTRVLRDSGDELPRVHRVEFLERVGAAAERLSALIDELLTVTNIEAGVRPALMADTDIAALLADVRDEAVDPAAVSVPDGLVLHATTDGQVLRHALALLVDNALKYAGDAFVTAEVVDRALVIDVRDHGAGIDPEVRGRIFERFVRGRHTSPGMGLGLPLVRTLVGSLGGRVDVVDGEGPGATFRLRVPLPDAD